MAASGRATQPNDPKKAFASRLKELRLAAGFERARHFAEAIGIAENRYSRYERGEAVPDLELLAQLCDKLGVTPNDLMPFAARSDSHPPTGGADRDISHFGEEGDAVYLAEGGLPASADGNDGQSAAASSPKTDVAILRLAHELTVALTRTGAIERGSANPLASARSVAALVRQLRADPAEAIDRVVSDPKIEAAPRKLKQHLSAEIDRFFRSVLSQPGRQA